MTTAVAVLLILFGVGGAVSFFQGLRQTRHRNNPHGLTPWYWIYGIFVWGDAIPLGIFWTMVSTLCLLLQNTHVFLITTAVFWMVRSWGEGVYWFLQQFATNKKDPPHTLLGRSIFPGESIWFAYQVFWQIILVISTVSLLYLLRLF